MRCFVENNILINAELILFLYVIPLLHDYFPREEKTGHKMGNILLARFYQMQTFGLVRNDVQMSQIGNHL